MANPTAQDAIDRARELLNEQAAGLYNDTAAGFFHWVTSGIRHFHREVMQAILAANQGQLPQVHQYVRHWIIETEAVMVAGTQDYALPDTVDILLFVMTGDPYRLAERTNSAAQALNELSRLVGPRAGVAKWTMAPANEIRFFVSPGIDGVPSEATPYRITSTKLVTRVISSATVLDLPWEYMDTALWYIMAQAVVKERKVYDAFLTMGREQVKSIP